MVTDERSNDMTWTQALKEAREYWNLCEEAERLGIPTSLDDPRSPRTVQGLRDAIAAAR